MKRQLKVGVIGLGIGEQHIIGYNNNPKCKVKTICDFNIEKLKEISEKYPACETTLDPNDILLDKEISVVSIASFDNHHASQVVKALENKKHVFVEKPLCLLRSEYSDIEKCLLANEDLYLSSNLILRKTPRFIELKKRIDSGQMGIPYLYEANYDYGRIEKILDGWRGHIDFYSVMHGGGIHLIDLMLWLSNSKIISVKALSTKISTASSNFRYPDCISASLEFENKAIGHVTANFSSITEHGHRLVVNGVKGTFNHGPLGAAYFWGTDKNPKTELINDTYPGTRKSDLIDNFIDSILVGEKPAISSKEVMAAMNVSLAIEESLKTGKNVSIRYFHM